MATQVHRVSSSSGVGSLSALPLTLSQVPIWAGLASMAVGGLVLLGWALDVEGLKSMIPGVLTMKSNAALSFVLMGAGLAILSSPEVRPPTRLAAFALVGAAAAIALLTGVQYLTGVDLGIDQLLFLDPSGQLGTGIPGRMAPATIICLTSLAFAAVARARSPRTVVVLSAIALALAYLNILDYLYDAEVPGFLAGSTQMAVNTAATIAILGVGMLTRLGPTNPLTVLSGRSAAAVLLRRLLVVSFVVPIAMMWLRLEGERLGWYDTSFGASLVVVGITVLSFIAIIHSARWASALEATRTASELERDRSF